MTLFYLLQHYNAENKATYDAQKRERKEIARAQKGMPKKKSKKEAPDEPPAFAVPGHPPPRITPPSPQQQPPHMPQPPPQGYAQQQPAHQPAQPPPHQPQHQPSHQQAQQPVRRPPGMGGYGVPGRKDGVLNFGDTIYGFTDDTNSDSGTVMLGHDSAMPHIKPYLIRKGNQERILIDKQPFRLGRDRSYADYAIPENRHIGNSHCHIVIRDGEYFIVDDNSKNHTYVDGKMIPGSTEVKIAHGQAIRLANEEFEFRLH
jgi:hypothetical protein